MDTALIAVIVIFSGMLGLIIGSFLNVIIFRMHTGKGIGGRSMCLSCGKTLSWYELIPVFSFLFQRGRCTQCRSKISWQYPLVEGATALLFGLVAFAYAQPLVGVLYAEPLSSSLVPLIPVVFWFAMIAIGMVIAVYDFRHRVIPVGGLVAFLALCLVGGCLGGMVNFQFLIPTGAMSGALGIWGHVAGAALVPLPFFAMWVFSRGRLMGFGDIELMAGIGFLFGVVSGFSAVALAFWVGVLVVGITFAVRRLALKRGQAIPFGPFLLIALFLVGVFGWDVFAIILGMR